MTSRSIKGWDSRMLAEIGTAIIIDDDIDERGMVVLDGPAVVVLVGVVIVLLKAKAQP